MPLRERKDLVLPPAQHTDHLNPFLPLCFCSPKCNYKPGEGGYCGLGSLQNTASTPALGGIKRPGCPSKAPLHLTAPWTVAAPSHSRLTPCFQHHWVRRFSPGRTELVRLIKTKKRISLLGCIITSINTLCTYTHTHKNKCVCTHTTSHCERFKPMRIGKLP